ncbi:hypothetical protein JCM6882_005690 [Rhodosporidiobolus microsporus]
MGALCGKEDHFDNLGAGQTLGGASSNGAKSSNAAPPPAPAAGYSVASKGKSASTSPPQRLGGDSAAPPGGGGDAERREAMLKAVEAREASAKTRGTSGGGKIASQLQNQSKDGGRAAEARLEAERRGQQLVWD